MPSTRTFAILCGGSFAALLIIGWGGNILQASGLIRGAGAWRLPILCLMLGLAVLLAFSAIPLMVTAVLGFQRGGAGANMPTNHSALSGRSFIIYAIWTVIAVGIAIAVPAAISSGAFNQ